MPTLRRAEVHGWDSVPGARRLGTRTPPSRLGEGLGQILLRAGAQAPVGSHGQKLPRQQRCQQRLRAVPRARSSQRFPVPAAAQPPCP